MVQGYYTLQEAAKFLRMPLDELKQMAQKGQIRSFQDRGTLRFRIQDIQELARARGGSSDEHELALGDASLPPVKTGAPSSASRKGQSPKSPAKKQGIPEVFDFSVDADSVDVGAEPPAPTSGAKSKPPSSKGKRTVTPPPGSDSDVRLVADGSDVTFSIPKDSDIKLADSDVRVSPDPLKPKSGVHTPPTPASGAKPPSQHALGSDAQRKSKPASPRPGATPQPADSGVRLVPMDDDSDVKLHGSSDEVSLGESENPATSDSNVRLEKVGLPPADSAEGSMHLTEEINLDEELQKQQELEKDKPSTKMKAKSELKLPTHSPFELSDSDLELPSELKAKGPKTPVKAEADTSDSSDFDLAAQKDPSSDFDLEAQKDGSSDFDLVPSEGAADSGDFSLDPSDAHEQVLEQETSGELTGSKSGISLDNPVDAGISLEDGGSSSDFDLSLEVEATPKPQKSSPIDDSDSEFELSAQHTPKPKKGQAPVADDGDSSEFDLSLDADAADAPADTGDSSEFELNLEGSGEVATGSSDSEFELTLDDSGNVEAVQEETPQVKSKAKKKKPATEEQDIFDTDFEVPALEESSSDDATVADSELESSDFDLALDDSELAQEEESGSQVVALDEEDAAASSEDAAVVDDVEVEDDSAEFSDLDQDVEVEDEDVEVDEDEAETAGGKVRTRTVVEEKLIPPAPWGAFPVVFMLPCVLIMFLVGILGFELVQTTAGLKQPGPLVQALADTFGTKIALKTN